MPQTTIVLGGRYELGSLLGRGGMARVFAATDRVLERPVAVKILAEPYDRDHGFVARFRREAQAAARLNHPNIVAVFDSGSDGDRHFIVTELVDGETLSAVLAREGPMAPERVVEIGRQVCRALAAAHDAGIVHRDVKPGNVMLASGGVGGGAGVGVVKVVDFGIAQAAGDEAITRSGWILGSVSYLSPEQARGERADERTDLYALGCVMYEALAGRPPFVSDSPVATLYLHVHQRPAPLARFASRVPPELEAAVMRCLEKSPGRRFASAGDLERALEDVGAPSATLPLPLPVEADAVAAAVESTEAAVTPTAALAVAPTAPVAGPTAPVAATAAPVPTGRHRRPSRRTRAIVVAAMVVGLSALAVAMFDDPGLVLDRGGGPNPTGGSVASSPSPDARSSVSPTASPSTTVEAPLDVAGSFAALIEAIDAAFLAGAIPDDHDAEKLRDAVFKIADRYQHGTLEDVDAEAASLFGELEELTDEGRMAFEAAEEIGVALEAVLAAVDADPPSTSEESGDGDGDGDEGDD